MSTTHHISRARRGRRWRAAAAASVLAFAPLTLAACGGGDDAAAAGSADAANSEDFQAFQECMAENGVEMGAPPSQQGDSAQAPPEMADQDAMAAAQEACADLAPEGMGQGGPQMGQGGGVDLQAYTDCLSENGVEVQGPGSGGEPPSGEPPSGEAGAEPPSAGSMFGLDESDPEVAAALEACADLEPEAPQGAPGAAANDSTTESS